MPSRSDFVAIQHLRDEGQGALNAGILLVKNRRNNTKCIEKRFDRACIERGFAAREVKAMRLCSHRNICALIAYDLEYRAYGYGSMFVEHCELGSLQSLVKRFAEHRVEIPEGLLWKVLFDTAVALTYLLTGVDAERKAKHGECVTTKARNWIEIVHRDIKPANIFLTKRDATSQYPTIVLGDFGCSITSTDMHGLRMTAFTRAFEPPEAPCFSDVSDIYSLALSVHCMAQLRQVPFRDVQRARRDPLGGVNRYSAALDGVLKRCLREKSGQRPDAFYLPYLVWRQKEAARQEMSWNKKAYWELPAWAFRSA